MSTQTPGQAAKAWAAANPAQTGAIQVISLTRKGKGGRLGSTTKTTVFYIKEGQAAQTRGQGDYRNGFCWVCKQIFLKPTLQTVAAPDPEAGQPKPDAEMTWQDPPGTVRNDLAYLDACPECIERLELKRDYNMMRNRSVNPPIDWMRAHPTYRMFWYEGLIATLDLTGDQQ